MLSLSCTPLKLLFGWTWPMRVRRSLGLFCFFTVLAHFTVYLWLDQRLMLLAVLEDLEKRPFILVGFLALVLLMPLAFTSSKAWVSRLGYRSWSRLHKLVYLIACLGVLHFFLRVKKDLTQPLLYAAVLATLFSVRLIAAYQKSRQRRLRLGSGGADRS
jgi:sulfoxide reductase heme-binding subunit YedZ